MGGPPTFNCCSRKREKQRSLSELLYAITILKDWISITLLAKNNTREKCPGLLGVHEDVYEDVLLSSGNVNYLFLTRFSLFTNIIVPLSDNKLSFSQTKQVKIALGIPSTREAELGLLHRGEEGPCLNLGQFQTSRPLERGILKKNSCPRSVRLLYSCTHNRKLFPATHAPLNKLPMS